METISSAEFRKTYAKLAVTTLVTVNGHVIGTWRPINAPVEKMSRGNDTARSPAAARRHPASYQQGRVR